MPSSLRVSSYSLISIGFIFSGLLAATFAPRLMGFYPPIAGLLLFLAYKSCYGSWPKISSHTFLWSIVITALIFISSLWSLDPHTTIERGVKILGVMIGGSLLISQSNSLSSTYIKPLHYLLPICLLIMALICITDLYGNGVIYRLSHLDETGPFNKSLINRNIIIYTLTLIITMPFIYYGTLEKKWKTAFIVLNLIAAAFVLYKTDSQSAHLSLAIAFIFMLFFPYKSKIAWISLVILLCSLLVAAPFIAQYLYNNVADQLTAYSWFQNSYAAIRLEIWDFISRFAMNQPLYGHGANVTRTIIFEHAHRYLPDATILHPHNFVLQIWIEFGLIGILMTMLFFTHLLSSINKAYFFHGPAVMRIFLPLLFAYITIASTAYGLWQGWWIGSMFYFLALSTLCIKVIPIQSETEEEKNE